MKITFKAAGIEGLRLHDLRHSYASHTFQEQVLQDWLAHDIAQDLEKHGFHIDVETVKATLAKLLASERDEIDAFIKKYGQKIKARRRAVVAQLFPPAVQKKMERKKLARVIVREHAARVDKLRRCGVPKPAMQAWEELAKRWGHASGGALYTWVRRNR